MVYAQFAAHVVEPIAQMAHLTSFAIFLNDILTLGASYCTTWPFREGLCRRLGRRWYFFFI